ncbi:hypothetical protein FISHEDRAFT_59401 [Fistulina hepatica ATCC 64428]|uniref:Uncharacterized protein n=1 Tax=Fistulina hepatica ATCC 64428 TaxID=1128425 RepID=A0A0D7ABM7_9AGAR|nr:hypothetical protein FISHEDRAFT_59401 [Fistulina hepatica ATCC 64428]
MVTSSGHDKVALFATNYSDLADILEGNELVDIAKWAAAGGLVQMHFVAGAYTSVRELPIVPIVAKVDDIAGGSPRPLRLHNLWEIDPGSYTEDSEKDDSFTCMDVDTKLAPPSGPAIPMHTSARLSLPTACGRGHGPEHAFVILLTRMAQEDIATPIGSKPSLIMKLAHGLFDALHCTRDATNTLRKHVYNFKWLQQRTVDDSNTYRMGPVLCLLSGCTYTALSSKGPSFEYGKLQSKKLSSRPVMRNQRISQSGNWPVGLQGELGNYRRNYTLALHPTVAEWLATTDNATPYPRMLFARVDQAGLIQTSPMNAILGPAVAVSYYNPTFFHGGGPLTGTNIDCLPGQAVSARLPPIFTNPEGRRQQLPSFQETFGYLFSRPVVSEVNLEPVQVQGQMSNRTVMPPEGVLSTEERLTNRGQTTPACGPDSSVRVHGQTSNSTLEILNDISSDEEEDAENEQQATPVYMPFSDLIAKAEAAKEKSLPQDMKWVQCVPYMYKGREWAGQQEDTAKASLQIVRMWKRSRAKEEKEEMRIKKRIAFVRPREYPENCHKRDLARSFYRLAVDIGAIKLLWC